MTAALAPPNLQLYADVLRGMAIFLVVVVHVWAPPILGDHFP
jgi:peptidoglycan/LPS O-acetylase OafA/YrhL